MFVCFEWNANIEQKEIRTEQVCKIGFSKYRCRQNYTCKIFVGSKGFINKGERSSFGPRELSENYTNLALVKGKREVKEGWRELQ